MTQLFTRKPASIFKRYFIFTSITVMFCLLVSFFVLVLFLVNFWKNDCISSLSENALSLARSVDALYDAQGEEAVFSGNDMDFSSEIAEYLFDISQFSDNELFIVSPDGTIILCKDTITVKDNHFSVAAKCKTHSDYIFDTSILTADLQQSKQFFTAQGNIFQNLSQEYFATTVPYYTNNGELMFYIVADKTVADAYLPYTTQVVRMLIFTAALALLITFIASLAVSVRMVKPLKKITAVTKDYARGDFSERISSVDTYKELTDLVTSFNSMADSLALTEKSRSGFVANVSHELKTPMTIISGFIDGILDGTISSEDSPHYLQIVSDESKRLTRLVIAMLNMSKIEAGKLSPTYSEVHLDTMLCRTMLGFEKLIEQKHIDVIGLELLPATVINADEALINQVIYNLIDNAVKFTSQNGSITFGMKTNKKTTTFFIRNSGISIPQEDSKLIFDRFYKVDKSRGLDTKSFGMGLYIVKSIIDLHKGSISIHSSENSYTQFTVELPLDCSTSE